MIKLVFLLEEKSAKAFLDSFLPKILSDKISYQCVPHEGKQDLEKSIPRKLRGWREPNAFFVVLRDQDMGDCLKIKRKLRDLCLAGGREETLVRIACRELESWFLGDLKTVENVFTTSSLSKLQVKKKYRNPDRIVSPSSEMRKLVPEYEKISGARLLGGAMDGSQINASVSFNHFLGGLQDFVKKIDK